MTLVWGKTGGRGSCGQDVIYKKRTLKGFFLLRSHPCGSFLEDSSFSHFLWFCRDTSGATFLNLTEVIFIPSVKVSAMFKRDSTVAFGVIFFSSVGRVLEVPGSIPLRVRYPM